MNFGFDLNSIEFWIISNILINFIECCLVVVLGFQLAGEVNSRWRHAWAPPLKSAAPMIPQTNSIQSNPIQFNSIQFNSIQLNSTAIECYYRWKFRVLLNNKSNAADWIIIQQVDVRRRFLRIGNSEKAAASSSTRNDANYYQIELLDNSPSWYICSMCTGNSRSLPLPLPANSSTSSAPASATVVIIIIL